MQACLDHTLRYFASTLRDRCPQLVARFRQPTRAESPYQNDPVRYAREKLGITLWGKQIEAAESLLKPPYKTLVKASHNVGKTFLAAALVSWWYDTRNPSIVLTTAPTDRQVRDLLWKEVRTQRGRLGGFRGPMMPRLESAPDHFAHGFTARDGDAFQGHHGPAILIVFDESVGVHPAFWETAKTMFAGENHAWLCIHNPTDTSSQAYLEENTGNWHVVTMSALDHPNIPAELAGDFPPFPTALRLGRLKEMLGEWCTPLPPGKKALATDIEWPPGSGTFLRPGPLAEARLLGRWPSQSSGSVWSDADFQAASVAVLAIPPDAVPEIGCDVARYGDDFTVIHVRCGPVSLHHEAVNGWSTTETAGRLKQLAREFCQWRIQTNPDWCELRPEEIPIKLDDDGVGGGVTDQAGDFTFIPVNAGSAPYRADDYPNRRSELWFQTAALAREGLLSFARLDPVSRHRIRQQCMAPTWKLDAAGRRTVEPKEKTKEKIGRSPDDADSVNLAFCPAGQFIAPPIIKTQARASWEDRPSAAGRRGLFGRSE